MEMNEVARGGADIEAENCHQGDLAVWHVRKPKKPPSPARGDGSLESDRRCQDLTGEVGMRDLHGRAFDPLLRSSDLMLIL